MVVWLFDWVANETWFCQDPFASERVRRLGWGLKGVLVILFVGMFYVRYRMRMRRIRKREEKGRGGMTSRDAR